MRPGRGYRKWVVGLALSGAALIAPSVALADPPSNDAYLNSDIIVQSQTTGMKPQTLNTFVDTTDATTQADLFNPDPGGPVTSGGGAEPTSCLGVPYGKTVWYDLRPNIPGDVEITTAAGFRTAIALYQYDPNTSLLASKIDCQTTGTFTNDLAEATELQAHRFYTIQIGGVQTAAGIGGGQLDLKVTFFPDHDGDGTLDLVDQCEALKGVDRFAGCPPTIVPTPHYGFADTGSGTTLSSFTVANIPGGAKVQVRCRRCGINTTQTAGAKASSVTFKHLVGKTIPSGDKLEIWVTKKASGTKNYRYGAIGGYLAYTARNGKLNASKLMCLMPGSLTPRTQCPPGGKKKTHAAGAAEEAAWTRLAGSPADRRRPALEIATAR
jgi:hypothetical protein